jgi:hypothetical protein
MYITKSHQSLPRVNLMEMSLSWNMWIWCKCHSAETCEFREWSVPDDLNQCRKCDPRKWCTVQKPSISLTCESGVNVNSLRDVHSENEVLPMISTDAGSAIPCIRLYDDVVPSKSESYYRVSLLVSTDIVGSESGTRQSRHLLFWKIKTWFFARIHIGKWIDNRRKTICGSQSRQPGEFPSPLRRTNLLQRSIQK